VDSLARGYLPRDKRRNDVVLLYYHVPSESPILYKYFNDKEGNCKRETLVTYDVNTLSADVNTLKTVIADAEKACPAKTHSLVLWSHATGFLPPGYYYEPKDTKSFAVDGMDTDNEMDIKDLAAALPHHYDFILLDCCLMGGIEVAYELRNKCSYLIMSPTEVLAESFSYLTLTSDIIYYSNLEESLKRICDHYMAKNNYKDCTVVLVKCSELDNLASVSSSIFKNHREELAALDPDYVQEYFRYDKHWFYDYGDIMQQIASFSEYANVTQALDKAVIYKDAADSFLGVPIYKYSGLSMYLPNPKYTYLNNYYKSLQWNKATGLVE
jgi:Clostripain family.